MAYNGYSIATIIVFIVVAIFIIITLSYNLFFTNKVNTNDVCGCSNVSRGDQNAGFWLNIISIIITAVVVLVIIWMVMSGNKPPKMPSRLSLSRIQSRR